MCLDDSAYVLGLPLNGCPGEPYAQRLPQVKPMTAEAYLQMCRDKGFIVHLLESWAVVSPPRFAVLQLTTSANFQGNCWQLGLSQPKLTAISLAIMERTFEAWPHLAMGTPRPMQQKLKEKAEAHKMDS